MLDEFFLDFGVIFAIGIAVALAFKCVVRLVIYLCPTPEKLNRIYELLDLLHAVADIAEQEQNEDNTTAAPAA